MATKKISQLTLATGVTGVDLVPIVQGGVTKRAAISLLGGVGATGATGPGVTGPTGLSYTNVVVTPTALAANATVTGYSPGAGDIYRLAVTGSTGVTIRDMGITGIDGDAKLLINVGATAPITLNHATGPNANARFAVPWLGNYVLEANGGAALIVYDSTSSVWRVV